MILRHGFREKSGELSISAKPVEPDASPSANQPAQRHASELVPLPFCSLIIQLPCGGRIITSYVFVWPDNSRIPEPHFHFQKAMSPNGPTAWSRIGGCWISGIDLIVFLIFSPIHDRIFTPIVRHRTPPTEKRDLRGIVKIGLLTVCE